MKRIFVFTAMFFAVVCSAQTGTRFTEAAPDSAVLFFPGKISDWLSNRDMAVSPDGKEIFYTVQHGNGALSFIMHVRNENNKWTEPEVASFSGRYNDLEPAFSTDGNTLYFSSNRPLDAKADSVKDYDIWSIVRLGEKWGEPVNLGPPVNSTKDEFYPSVPTSRNIYFTRDVGKNKEDIVVCFFRNGKYDSAQSLPEAVNTAGFEFNAFVSPDEQYIIFSGYNRKDGFGSADLYISRKNAAGEWEQAKNLGRKINSEAMDYCPFVSFDNKYFFFASKRSSLKSPLKKKAGFGKIKEMLNSHGNGLDDIYWIKRESIF